MSDSTMIPVSGLPARRAPIVTPPDSGEKRAVSKRTWIAGVCLALVVAGCQGPAADPFSPPNLAATIPGPVASNELGALGVQDLEAGNNGLAEQHFREAVEKNHDDYYSWVGLAAVQ